MKSAEKKLREESTPKKWGQRRKIKSRGVAKTSDQRRKIKRGKYPQSGARGEK